MSVFFNFSLPKFKKEIKKFLLKEIPVCFHGSSGNTADTIRNMTDHSMKANIDKSALR